MDTLVQGYPVSMEGCRFNHRSVPVLRDQGHENGYTHNNHHHGFEDLPNLSNGLHPGDESPSDVDASEEREDYSDAILNYINYMLMEEGDLEHKPCMYHDCSALQAAEKSFYDVLGQKYPPSPSGHPPFAADQDAHSPDDGSIGTCSSNTSKSSTDLNNFVESNSNWIHNQGQLFENSSVQSSHLNNTFDPNLLSSFQSFSSSNGFYSTAVNGLDGSPVNPFQALLDSSHETEAVLFFPNDYHPNNHLKGNGENPRVVPEAEDDGRDLSPDGSRGKKNHNREDDDNGTESRKNKQLASYIEDSESEMYDRVLLCKHEPPCLNDNSPACPAIEVSSLEQNQQAKRSGRGRPRGKKQGTQKDVVDLRSLLTQCAQAVSSYDSRTANELLKRIKQHSSPYGDGVERLAYYFSNALEARLAGTGTALYTAFASRRISAADILKAYQVYISACPFKIMPNIFANKSIKKAAKEATRIHVIDFGILYGFQWPCLIQGLSTRPGGPPKLRITGIDLPQPGFRPAERVEDTGRRLESYCERFKVPFEYNAVAKKWDTIQLEDLKIDREELLVVNCLFRLGNVPDETVVASSPRDAVLNLIKNINPDMFIHGVTNGTYSAPFFVTRFREALFHFSALFDMFDATTPREHQERMLFEKEIFGRDAMNVIACEGTERIERPETYRQWQVRNARAGFRQLPLDQEIVKFVRGKVKAEYHRDFVVDEDGAWMLQGWKGRVMFALSCWKPVQE